MIKGLHHQGWFATKTSDRFKAGRPDLRIAHDHYGQIDVELKYALVEFDSEEDTGIKLLQQIKMKEMNMAGMPAVGLVFVEPRNLFFVTLLLRETLPLLSRCVPRLRGSEVVSGPALFVKAMEYLTDDLGFHPGNRNWREARP